MGVEVHMWPSNQLQQLWGVPSSYSSLLREMWSDTLIIRGQWVQVTQVQKFRVTISWIRSAHPSAGAYGSCCALRASSSSLRKCLLKDEASLWGWLCQQLLMPLLRKRKYYPSSCAPCRVGWSSVAILFLCLILLSLLISVIPRAIPPKSSGDIPSQRVSPENPVQGGKPLS